MTDPNGSWAWLEEAAREARQAIENLYVEGRSQLVDDPTPPDTVTGRLPTIPPEPRQ